ncbi:MAG TPA: cation transporter [Firmicutes bacterium]|jgi:cation diffusion facilitator family transporter|nr:cation transporter [Bacillota bacterium]
MVKRITDWLLAVFIPKHENLEDPQVRARYGFLEAWISIVGNIILSVLKVIIGVALNSVSLLADAAHTFSDVITSVVVLVGFHASRRRPDKEHPFGHGRVELVSTLIIALLLALVGLEFGRTSLDRLLHGNAVTGTVPAAMILVISGLAKELMAGISLDLGQRINSPALRADAWHHRSDAIASVLVAVAIIAARYGYPAVDSILGLAVSALIIYTAWQLGSTAGSSLVGEAPDRTLLREIIGMAKKVPGVMDVHDVAVHDYGTIKAISLHIVVPGDTSFMAAHEIATKVENMIRNSLSGPVVVHVDPSDSEADSLVTLAD